MSESVNKDLTRIQDVFKLVVWDNLRAFAIRSLFAGVPWLKVWPLGPIIKWLAGSISDTVFETIKLNIDLAALKFMDSNTERHFNDSIVKLKLIERDYGVESKEYKEARDDARKIFAAFIRFHA